MSVRAEDQHIADHIKALKAENERLRQERDGFKECLEAAQANMHMFRKQLNRALVALKSAVLGLETTDYEKSCDAWSAGKRALESEWGKNWRTEDTPPRGEE